MSASQDRLHTLARSPLRLEILSAYKLFWIMSPALEHVLHPRDVPIRDLQLIYFFGFIYVHCSNLFDASIHKCLDILLASAVRLDIAIIRPFLRLASPDLRTPLVMKHFSHFFLHSSESALVLLVETMGDNYMVLNNILIFACYYSKRNLIELCLFMGAGDIRNAYKAAFISGDVGLRRSIRQYKLHVNHYKKFHASPEYIVYHQLVDVEKHPATSTERREDFLAEISRLQRESPFEREYLNCPCNIIEDIQRSIALWHRQSLFRIVSELTVGEIELIASLTPMWKIPVIRLQVKTF